MSELDVLKEKVDLLIKKYNDLKIQCENLKQALAVQEQTVASKEVIIASLETQLQQKNLASINHLLSDDEKQTIHAHLDKIIHQLEVAIQSL